MDGEKLRVALESLPYARVHYTMPLYAVEYLWVRRDEVLHTLAEAMTIPDDSKTDSYYKVVGGVWTKLGPLLDIKFLEKEG